MAEMTREQVIQILAAGGNLRGASLSEIDLSHLDFSRATLHGADFSYSNLHGSNFAPKTLLTERNFPHYEDTNVQVVLDLRKTLWWVNFQGTDLTDADLRNCTFRLCRFQGATLAGARLEGIRGISPIKLIRQANRPAPVPKRKRG
jgi:uncharacterized protein YjbI with pentapeptide repeats